MHETTFHRAIADFSRDAPHPRFVVYRNNVSSALSNALRVRYPVVEKLLGARIFTAITQNFIATNRPRSPVLIDYGDDYPDFVAAHTLLPYLADVARLEGLWWRAYHAAEAEPAAPECFSGLSADNLETARLSFHPSAAILISPWAIGAIWEAARQNIDLNETEITQAQSVLVWRPREEVRVNVIDHDTALFLTALMDGKGLVEAITAHPRIDLQAQFQSLIASELITEIHS
jgi:hypothetical protein